MSIRLQQADRIARITIDRPAVLNALDTDHLERLLAAVHDAADAQEGTRVIVLDGHEKAFSAGADIKAMRHMTDADFAHMAGLYQRLASQVRGLDIPMIAALSGHVLGGGLEIALLCDIRIAARSARLGLPDGTLGFSPTGGLTWLLPRIVGLGRALDLALLGDPVDAMEAERIGLVTRVVEDDQLQDCAQRLALRIAEHPPRGVRNTRHAFLAALDTPFHPALSLEQAFDTDCYADPEVRARLRDALA